MPLLAPKYTVLALDLPGLGDSDPPPGNAYDEQTIALLLHSLLGQLGYQKIELVGHDLGRWMAYAYAAQYGPEVNHLVLLDATLPGKCARPPRKPRMLIARPGSLPSTPSTTCPSCW